MTTRLTKLCRSESRALASSLPPPPSALSDTTSQSSHSDEEEGDGHQPPDFTSRVPLVSSRSHSSRSRRPRPSATSSSSHTTSPTWAGLRLGGPREGLLPSSRRAAAGMSAKERALWRWINVEDLDAFLQQVYLYYVGKGIWAMLLERVLNLLWVWPSKSLQSRTNGSPAALLAGLSSSQLSSLDASTIQCFGTLTHCTKSLFRNVCLGELPSAALDVP